MNSRVFRLIFSFVPLVCLTVMSCERESRRVDYQYTTEGVFVQGKVALILDVTHGPCIVLNVTNPADFGRTGECNDWCCAEYFSFVYDNTVLITNPFNENGDVGLNVLGSEKFEGLVEGKMVVAICVDTTQLPSFYTPDSGASIQNHWPLTCRKLAVKEVLDVY